VEAVIWWPGYVGLDMEAGIFAFACFSVSGEVEEIRSLVGISVIV
jgi:hypothetical protein